MKANLSVEQVRARTRFFDYWIDEGCTPDEAHREAWREMQEEFPELQGLDGCEVEQ